MAKQTHPDLHGGSQEYAERFREVTDAYALLSDPVQRDRYDRNGSADQQQVSASTQEIYAAIAYVRAQAADARRAAQSYARRGLAWFAGGAIISFLGFAAAGGGYPIFWGAMLVGGYQTLRGCFAYIRIGAQARRLEQNMWDVVTGSAAG